MRWPDQYTVSDGMPSESSIRSISVSLFAAAACLDVGLNRASHQRRRQGIRTYQIYPDLNRFPRSQRDENLWQRESHTTLSTMELSTSVRRRRRGCHCRRMPSEGAGVGSFHVKRRRTRSVVGQTDFARRSL